MLARVRDMHAMAHLVRALYVRDRIHFSWLHGVQLTNGVLRASRGDHSLKLPPLALRHLVDLIQSVLRLLHQILLTPIRRTILDGLEIRLPRARCPTKVD